MTDVQGRLELDDLYKPMEPLVGFVRESEQAVDEDLKTKAVEALETWLDQQHDKETPELLRKSLEYGQADLNVMGAAMKQLLPEQDSFTYDEEFGIEMALCFYALGKVARAFGAYKQGKRPSDDTLLDLHIYGLMALKVRQTGRWL